MAAGDYRSCDVCGRKAFYDANLNYLRCSPVREDQSFAYRTAGVPQFESPEYCRKYGGCLDNLGDWAVLCCDCAKTHKTQIVEIAAVLPPATNRGAK